MSEIIVVDDERSMREFLEILFTEEGWGVRCAQNLAEATSLAEERTPNLMVTDMKMKGGSGLDLLKQMKRRFPEVEVIVITAYATTETAIEALKLGAYDYITKPFQVDEIRVVVNRALERQRLLRENLRMRAVLAGRTDYDELVGSSARMKEIYRLIEQVAPTKSSVLITGESGTGKELVARAIHHSSPRKDGPFVPIDCASIPDQLLESELFGYARGAFTGAVSDRKGLFELGDGGTLFLDEIAEVPLNVQVKLLRVLQERSVKRLGEGKDRSVDVRVVAATNRDIDVEVRRGSFREDLYFRLNVIRLHLPPLSKRRDDIPALVRHFIHKLANEEGRSAPVVLTEAIDALSGYEFPGNVRELQNMVERAVALSGGRPIGAELFSQSLGRNAAPEGTPTGELPEEGVDLDVVLAGVERDLLQTALQRTGGVKKEAAKLLGISFRSIRYRLLKHDME